MATRSGIDKREQITASLVQRLDAGDWREGDRLNELALSQEFRCSRTPVREAIATLAAAGLVRRQRGRGVVVTRPASAAGLKSLRRRYRDVPTSTASDDGVLSIEDQCARAILSCLSGSAGTRWSEAELAAETGFARSTLRLALRGLAARGVASETDRLWRLNALDASTLRAHYEHRVAIETHLLALGMARIDRAALRRIEADLAVTMARYATDGDDRHEVARAYHRHDMALHRAIWQAAELPALAQVVEDLKQREMVSDFLGTLDRRHIGETHAEHMSLCAAIHADNLPRAQSILAAHIRHVADWHIANLQALAMATADETPSTTT